MTYIYDITHSFHIVSLVLVDTLERNLERAFAERDQWKTMLDNVTSERDKWKSKHQNVRCAPRQHVCLRTHFTSSSMEQPSVTVGEQQDHL
jgi:hypothetical protein